ncbi:EcsC family protein [Sodalis sp. RH21]|uniref:EcsC family protein n=1 Tax=unclassified Sodalis (in: enterobacteria) TaxID=2636512 RepID=UPI0039B428BC
MLPSRYEQLAIDEIQRWKTPRAGWSGEKQAREQLEKQAFMKCLQHIGNAPGVRITKVKPAQVLPLAGAAVGAGYNAYFTAKVCDAAYYLYRERFLAGRVGAHIIQEIVQPPLSYQYPLS